MNSKFNIIDSKKIRLLCVGFFLFAGLLIRVGPFVNGNTIANNPGWFRDEGTYFEVADTIFTSGGPHVGSLNVTFASPFMTHPPVWFFVSGIWLKITGGLIPALRLFNVLLSIVLLWAVYRAGREISGGGWFAPLLATALLAFHPDAVFFHRMALPYTLFALEAVLAFWFMWRWDRSGKARDLAIALGMAAICPITVYYGIVVPVWVALFCLLSKNKKRRYYAALALLAFFPLAIFWLIGWLALPGFANDWTALGENGRAGSIAKIAEHYADYFSMGLFYSVGLMSCFLMACHWRKIARFALLPILLLHIVLQKEDTIIHVINYPLIAMQPFLALAIGLTAARLIDQTIFIFSGKKNIDNKGNTLRWITLGVVIIFNGVLSLKAASTTFPTTLEFGMIRNINDAKTACDYVNNHLEDNNYAVSTATLWGLIDGNAANIPQMLAWRGEQTDFYLYPIAPERFAFDLDPTRAQFLIVDRFLEERLKTPPGNPQYLFRLELERMMNEWELVLTAGAMRVYENPETRQN